MVLKTEIGDFIALSWKPSQCQSWEQWKTELVVLYCMVSPAHFKHIRNCKEEEKPEAALFDKRLLLIRGKLKEMFCDIFFNTRHSLPLTGNPVGPYKQFEH